MRSIIFSPEEIQNMNDFQSCSGFHPYTCGNGCGSVLIATKFGWECPTTGCDYHQTLTATWISSGEWKKHLSIMYKTIYEKTSNAKNNNE